MLDFRQLTDLLGGLKGARASVVLALLLAGRPLSQGELKVLTGYSVKPIRLALRALLEQGIVARDGPRVLVLSAGWIQKAAQSASEAVKPAQQAVETLPGAVSTTNPVNPAPERAPAETSAHQTRALLAAEMSEGTAELAAETGQSDHQRRHDHDSGRFDHFGGPLSPPKQQNVVVDPYRDQLDDHQQQQIPEAAADLAALLRRIGINGRAFRRLVARQDLAAKPEVVLAWWWYYRAQQGMRNPAGAAISRLVARDRPPEGYLALAVLWPDLSDELRQELESMVLRNWSAEQIAARLRPECPGLTAGAVTAFMALTLARMDS